MLERIERRLADGSQYIVKRRFIESAFAGNKHDVVAKLVSRR